MSTWERPPEPNGLFKESKSSSHGSPLGEDEIKLTRKNLNWNYDSFEIPEDMLSKWRRFAENNKTIRQKWIETTHLGAGNHTFEYGWRTRNSQSGNRPAYQINPNSSDDNRMHQMSSTFTFYEILI